ncbi:MAG: hypothetical protein HYT93_05000 [Parcubacteria group bacterium]|nr:hypothetical protein [Parcubacteria group bacterium]
MPKLRLKDWILGVVALSTLPLFFMMLVASSTISVYAQTHIQNELIVKTDGNESKLRLQEMNIKCGTNVLRITSGKEYILKITDNSSVEDAAACWKKFPEVEYVQLNFLLQLIPD